jgi:hypothetical protein
VSTAHSEFKGSPLQGPERAHQRSWFAWARSSRVAMESPKLPATLLLSHFLETTHVIIVCSCSPNDSPRPVSADGSTGALRGLRAASRATTHRIARDADGVATASARAAAHRVGAHQLINKLDALDRDVTMVFGDYHVIAIRAEPPRVPARLRARGELTELRSTDLRVSRDEASALRSICAVRLCRAACALSVATRPNSKSPQTVLVHAWVVTGKASCLVVSAYCVLI